MALLKYNRRLIFIQRCNKFYILIIVLLCFIIIYEFLRKHKLSPYVKSSKGFMTTETARISYIKDSEISSARELFNANEIHIKLMQEKIKRLTEKFEKSRSVILNNKPVVLPNYNIHTFYYAWYANLKTDGYFRHWNHNYLPNWKHEDQLYPTGSHSPIMDIGSNYYPQLGCYSSRDSEIISKHMKQIREAGIGVIVLSWTPPNYQDSPNDILTTIFEHALRYRIKIALHIEPYADRNPINLFKHLRQFLQIYAKHPALYKVKKPFSDKEVPLVYVYDSYLTPAIAWKELLSTKGNLSIRGTDIDAVFIGLLVDIQHRYHIKKSQFDGFYTYFAVNGFSYGSTWKNWKSLAKFALQNGLIFIPSVGPGYIDTQVRPWNFRNTRHRRHGQYYDVAWRAAIGSGINYVSITSFNEWHEGTQIEPAVPINTPGFTYLDYQPEDSHFYLNLTKWWVEQFEKSQKKN